jgi:hypothetical protein
MTTLIWKEFKENFKYAVGLFLVIGSLMVFSTFAVRGNGSANHGFFTSQCWLFFQVVGAVFGILQTFPELKRDRWSFLCHRSQSMNGIFFSKIIAGLGYYFFITVTLYLFSAWVISHPVKKSAPFYWYDLWTNVVFLITGMMSYFAAFLCGIRQRKWFGTRFFPLIFTILASFYFYILAESYGNLSASMTIPLALLSSALLGITCWAHFTRTLDEVRKPLFSRVVRLITMYMISVPVQVFLTFLITAIILVTIGSMVSREYVGHYYTYGKDGNTYKVGYDSHLKKIISVEDIYHPDRKLNPAEYEYKDKYGSSKFKNQLEIKNIRTKGETGLLSMFYTQSNNLSTSISSSVRFPYVNDNLFSWYYLVQEHKIIGYPYYKKKQIVTIECEFEKLIGIGDRSEHNSFGGSNPFLMTTENNGFFLYDANKQIVSPLTEPMIGKPIRNIGIHTSKDFKETLIVYEDEIAIHEALPRITNRKGELVEPELVPKKLASWAENNEGRYFHPNGYYPLHVQYIPGKKIASISFNHRIPNNTDIYLAKVPGENRYLVNFYRNYWQNLIWPSSRFKTYLEIDEKGTTSRKNQLSSIRLKETVAESALKAGLIPVGPLLGMMAYDASTSTEVDEFYGTSFSSRMKRNPQAMWIYIGLIFLSCIFAVAVTFWIGRRNSFTRKEMTFWMLFNFFLGWGGLLTMISAHQWIGKVKCESCGKKRLQTNTKCEHCDAEFPLPELDGTEIFVESRSIVPMAEVSSTAS